MMQVLAQSAPVVGFSSLLVPIAIFIGLIFAGILLKALLPQIAVAGPAINLLVINLTLPATVFLGVKNAADEGAAVGWDEVKIALLSLLVILVSAVLAVVAARLLKLPRRTEGAFVLVTMFGSTAAIGQSLVKETFNSGRANLLHVFYSEIGTLVPLVIIGVLVASYYGEAEERNRFSARTLLAIPKAAPFIALVLGLLFYNDPIPEPLTRFLEGLRSANAPFVFLALGLIINWQNLGRYLRSLLALNAIKLLVAPLVAVLLAGVLALSDDGRRVAVIDSAVPAVLLGIAYSAQYKLDVEFASAAVFSSFIFSAVTLPLMFALLGRLDVTANGCGKRKDG